MLKNRQFLPVLIDEDGTTSGSGGAQRTAAVVQTPREQMREIVKQQDEDFRTALRKQSMGITEQLSETLKSVVKNSCAHAVLDRSAKNFVKSAEPCIGRMEEMLAEMCRAAQVLHDAFVDAHSHTEEKQRGKGVIDDGVVLWYRLEAPKEGLMMGYGITSERESQRIAEGIIVSSPGSGHSSAQTPKQEDKDEGVVSMEHDGTVHEEPEAKPAAEHEDVPQEEKKDEKAPVESEKKETAAEHEDATQEEKKEEEAPVEGEKEGTAAEHEDAPQEEKKEEATPAAVETESTGEEGN